jgi:hypothetical protein
MVGDGVDDVEQCLESSIDGVNDFPNYRNGSRHVSSDWFEAIDENLECIVLGGSALTHDDKRADNLPLSTRTRVLVAAPSRADARAQRCTRDKSLAVLERWDELERFQVHRRRAPRRASGRAGRPMSRLGRARDVDNVRSHGPVECRPSSACCGRGPTHGSTGVFYLEIALYGRSLPCTCRHVRVLCGSRLKVGSPLRQQRLPWRYST